MPSGAAQNRIVVARKPSAGWPGGFFCGAGRIFLRGGEQTRSRAAEPVGNFLESQNFAEPVAEHDGERAEKKLFQTGRKSSVDIFPDEPQAKESRGGGERGLEKILRADGGQFAPHEPEQCAGQDAEAVKKCTGHAPIVSRRQVETKKKFPFANGAS